MPASDRHEVLTLSDVVVTSAFSVRASLARIAGLDIERIDEAGWTQLAIEYAVLHLFLISNQAHQVLEERVADEVVGQVAHRVTMGLADRLARNSRKVFGRVFSERFVQYTSHPLLFDPDAGACVEIESFDRVRGTVYGRFVEHLAPVLSPGERGALPPQTLLDLWIDSLARAEAWSHVYAPLLDLIEA